MSGHGSASKHGEHHQHSRDTHHQAHPHGEHKKSTIDKIIENYQGHHYRKGKTFEERIKKIEEFYDPENTHQLELSQEVDYIIDGKPDDRENFPGAYDKAYNVLAEHLKEASDKLEDEEKGKAEEKITEILEAYVDAVLEKAMGEKFSEILHHAESEGIKKEDIRKIKGRLFSQYHRNEKGEPIDVFNDKYIKALKGKKKVELIEELKGLADVTRKSYTQYLKEKAVEGLISGHDTLEMVKYLQPKLEKSGYTPKEHLLTKSMQELEVAHQLLLQGATDQLRKLGYKYKLKDDEHKAGHSASAHPTH